MEQAFSMHQTNAFKMFLFAMDNQYATYCNVTYCFLIELFSFNYVYCPMDLYIEHLSTLHAVTER